MKPEFLEVVDCFNTPIEGRFERDFVHRNGIWHRTINFLIVDSKLGSVYFQTKKIFDSEFFLNINGGHLLKNERTEDGFRELEEELGISKANIKSEVFLGKYQISVDFNSDFLNREFMYFFLVDIPGFMDKINFKDGEVKAVIGFKVQEAILLLQSKKLNIQAEYITSHKEEIELTKKTFKNFTDDQLYYKLMLICRDYLGGRDILELVI